MIAPSLLRTRSSAACNGERCHPGAEVNLGTPLARGRQAEVFDQGDGTVLKLFHDTAASGAVMREATVLRKLTSSTLRVPHVVDLVVLGGRPGIVMQRIDDADWLTRLGAQPWEALVIGRRLASAHLAVHAVNPPSGLPSTIDRLRRRLETSSGLDAMTRMVVLSKLQHLGVTPLKLCHGDYHLENVLGPLRTPCRHRLGQRGSGRASE